MPLPYTFISGNTAKSSEVNANFNYLMDLIGQASVPGSVSQLGEFKVGPRSLALFTGAQDTGPDADAHFQLAWNVNWNKVGSVWRFDRRITNQPATSLRIGRGGLEVYTTSQTTGDLNNQMTRILRLVATSGEDYMFLKDDIHLQNYDGTARNVQDYRLTTVLMETPVSIYNSKWVGAGTTIFNAYNLGIPSHAKGIIVYQHVTATGASGAGMHIYQRRPTNDGKNYFRGTIAHAPPGHRTGSQGFVPLGTGALKGDFVVYRTANFALANVYIMGYLT
jgi:hypothetical protein